MLMMRRTLLAVLSATAFASFCQSPVLAAGPPKFAYTTTLSAVGGYEVDPATGAIGAEVPGSPFQSSGCWASRLAVDPSGKFVFAVDRIGDEIEGFAIDPETGTLMDVPGSPFDLYGVEQLALVSGAPAAYCTPNYDVAPLPNTQTGNFNTTTEVCFMVESTRPLYFNCSEMSNRTVTVNGTLYQSSSCNSSSGKKVLLPVSADGTYYFDVSAGTPSWASIAFWNEN
jgi:hypothetical protein